MPPRAPRASPPKQGATTRDGARATEPPAPAPASYVGDVQGDARPWGISRLRPPPLRRWLERRPSPPAPAQPPPPPPGAAEARGSQWAPRRWAGWRLSPSRGRERGDWERASCRRAPGRGGGAAGGGGGAAEQPPEDHCSPRLRRTDAGPTPAAPRPRPPA